MKYLTWFFLFLIGIPQDCLRAANEDPYEPTKIREFTGAPTRVVWIQDSNDVPAVDAERPTLRLMGWDSEDDKGERPILSELAAYIKPLFTADGSRVVFGDNLKKTVSVVNWDGTGLKVLLEKAEFADVWTDPVTGIEWVYAHIQEKREDKEVPVIRRYRMDNPDVSELIWDKMPMFMFTLAGDGKAASGGGDGGNSPQGYLTLPNGTFTQRAGGCWPSITPDNSHRMWVFTGNHRSIHFFVPTSRNGIKAAGSTILLDKAPGLTLEGREEVHRIRWSNNTRFMVCSSPFTEWDYKGDVKVPDAVADKIEVYIGKFSEDLNTLERWMRVTSNDKGDYWADVWIKPGEGAQAAVLELPAEGAAEETDVELNRAGLIYTWETGAVGNQIDDAATGTIRQCSGELKDYARFARHHVMDLTRGWFVPDESPLLNECLKSNALTLEAILTPLVKPVDNTAILLFGKTIEEANVALVQRQSKLYLIMTTSSGGPKEFELGSLELNQPNHVLLSYNQGNLLSTINGRKAMIHGAPSGDFSNWKEAPLTYGAQLDGSRNWSGLMEGINILSRAVDFKEARQRYHLQKENRKDRESVEPMQVEAKLIERSPAADPKGIAPYRRCLNVQLYEVQRVIKGELPDKKIAVAQWSVLDGKVLPEYEAIQEGSIQVLEIEPWEKHPEQDSERKIEGEFLDDVKLYYDVTRTLEESSSEKSISPGQPLDALASPDTVFDANGNGLLFEAPSLKEVILDGAIKLSGKDSVAAVTMIDGGMDYSVRPNVKLIGSGTGAIAEAGMELASIQCTNLGEGFTAEPQVTISEPDIAGGRQATAKARIDAKSGALSGISITDIGSGYINRPTISIDGGGGSGARAEAFLAVSEVYVLNGGSGYTEPPVVEFVDGDGIGALAMAANQSTILRGTADNADVKLINRGKLEQDGGRILFDWAGSSNQPGKREFLNEGEWIMNRASLKFVSSTGRPGWFGRGNINSGTLRILNQTWLGLSNLTNTGELEIGDRAVIGLLEHAQGERVLVNSGNGIVRVTGGSVEAPAVFGINSLITNGLREVQNGSETDAAAAQWIIGNGKDQAAFRIAGGQVQMKNYKGSRLMLNRGASLMLETNDAGARHRFERREAKLTNAGEMLMAGALYIRSNHGSFGGIENSGKLVLEGTDAKLVRFQNSVGAGGLYRAPDYTSLILNQPDAELQGSGKLAYVDSTGEEHAAYMRIINLGNMTLSQKWTLENINVYMGAVPP